MNSCFDFRGQRERVEGGASAWKANRLKIFHPQDVLWKFYYIECKMNCQSNKKNTFLFKNNMHNILQIFIFNS